MGWGDDAALVLMVAPAGRRRGPGGFGWISRRFERQSDVMGARLAGEELPVDSSSSARCLGPGRAGRSPPRASPCSAVPCIA